MNGSPKQHPSRFIKIAWKKILPFLDCVKEVNAAIRD